MSELLHGAACPALALAGWLIPRHIAKGQMARPAALLTDVFPMLLGAGLLLIATGRPIFAGVVVLSLGAGFALADWSKREALREPVVFSDMSELRHVFTHPQLYLPFAGPHLVIGGALATLALGLGLLWLELPLWQPDGWLIAFSFGAVGAVAWTVSREPALGIAANILRRFDPIGEPVADAAALGPFSTLLVYGVVARAERATRRARFAPALGPSPADAAASVPLVLVQCESFFDARRASPCVPKDLLPGFDACLKRGDVTSGRIEVAGWGANTMRAEFAVLTGIPDRDLGFDRFNPYHAFARAPIASLAWRLRQDGYRTLCLHPFDRDFFRRDLTMRALGFESFLGRETLGGSNRPPYFSDPDLAREVLRTLDDLGPRTFIFVITMGNHGPWLETGLPIHPDLRRRFDPASLPQGGQFLRYLDGLAKSDEMLRILAEGLSPRQRDGVFGFYGDHLPSLPHAFDHLHFSEWASDYIVMDGTPASARRLDLPAHQLPRLILDRLHERNSVTERPKLAAGAA